MNTSKIKDILTELAVSKDNFENCLNSYYTFDALSTNPAILAEFIEECDYDVSALQVELDAHNASTASVSKGDIKQVYVALRDRDENPRGNFDKQGRFYVIDADLVDVRSPSFKYPYSQMNAARTAKFVKALAEKYKCQSIEELRAVAFA